MLQAEPFSEFPEGPVAVGDGAAVTPYDRRPQGPKVLVNAHQPVHLIAQAYG